MNGRRIISLMRRFCLWVVLVLALPAAAMAQTIEIRLGTGDATVHAMREPQIVLDRGGMVDGLPVRRRGGAVTVIAWSAMKRLIFIPGGIPTVVIAYRDGSESMFDVEPCRIVASGTDIDIHDVAQIDVR